MAHHSRRRHQRRRRQRRRQRRRRRNRPRRRSRPRRRRSRCAWGAALGLEPKWALAFAMQSNGMHCSGGLKQNQCQAKAIQRPEVQRNAFQPEAKRCNESRGTNAMQRSGSERNAMQTRWAGIAMKCNALQHPCESNVVAMRTA